eukprot:CAMPEP_0172495188 /NCGR_PEP_ID=MMETSP1066-20121228/64211_1 /TAXON_ID=671091 /ORGANISM="Coscinodiscus wailesii, Strain CCMP2513" /LENGTH=405 /DNA_ID=CAMNT_0013266701 /DNA_START=56 /DNA_END=1273 /DNA_ORIENTATION=+
MAQGSKRAPRSSNRSRNKDRTLPKTTPPPEDVESYSPNRANSWAIAFVLASIAFFTVSQFNNRYITLSNQTTGKYTLHYHNVNNRRLDENEDEDSEGDTTPTAPVPLEAAGLPKKGPVIAALVTNRQKDIDELQVALKSLAFLQGDDPEYPAPVLVFNEGDLSEEQTQSLVDSTTRPMAFPLVDFTIFPPGFDPNGDTSNSTGVKKFRVKDRSEWGYYQMIRFWITGIWKHPALEPYSTVMRIDSDSCFKEPNLFLPKFKNPNLVYYSQYVGFEDGKNFTIGLLDFAKQFMRKQNKVAANPMLWQFIETTFVSEETLPLFQTNFEVSKKEWMQQPEVMAWHDALTEEEPFGIFRYRWGDAVTRFLTAAMFATNEMIMTSHPDGYGHKERCQKEDVMAALATLAQA